MRRRQIDFLHHNSVLCEFDPVYRWAFPAKSCFLPPSISLRPHLRRERAAQPSFPKDRLSTVTKNSAQSQKISIFELLEKGRFGLFWGLFLGNRVLRM